MKYVCVFRSGKQQCVHFFSTAAAQCVWEQRTNDFYILFFLAKAFSSTWPHYISPGGYCQTIPHLNSVSLYWYNRIRERKTGTMYLYLSDSLLLYLHLSFLPCCADGFCQNSLHTLSVPRVTWDYSYTYFPCLVLFTICIFLPSRALLVVAVLLTWQRKEQNRQRWKEPWSLPTEQQLQGGTYLWFTVGKNTKKARY